ncbi:hypothetical protein NE686_03920 [Tissierella carlieri]|uniref:Uncharacterized protein n=1 Tax=Tissierella carlieri TaxID=689904 RepID=A0ABT1S6W6_9FIRM|nr:hypothetical protein [Tissierella carlieri]MCQ4922218.1 hypothetical protein [Tissierella carlieri]
MGEKLMFYIKEKLTETVEVTIEINDENVFCACPGCGDEVNVDISEVLSDGISDLYGTSIYCKECSEILTKKLWRNSHGCK